MDFLSTVTPYVEVASLYAGLLIWLLILILIAIVLIVYFIDVSQTKQTLRRNYPVIAHFRYWFEHLGIFFRQYFFAMDREELPFNRAQRSWVYIASKKLSTTVAFGSTKDLRVPGSVIFVNCPYPTLDQDAVESQLQTIGAYCSHPYTTASFFNISGMSYGAISQPAIEALAKGAYMAGCWLNTGEGGLSEHHLSSPCDIVMQIGTAKNGVKALDGTLDEGNLAKIASYDQVKMFEIKMSQGAKPGKGGILPAAKVTAEIAKVRGIEIGKDAISPNRHIEVNSDSDLLDMINRIRKIAQKPVGFKCAIGAGDWLDNLCEEINRRGEEFAPDFITIDGGDGGTAAAPMALIDEMGLPLRESLPLVCDALNRHNLRDRVKVIASGKLVTPADVAWALCMGANFIVSARGFMMSLGCIQALQCNKNTCPTGITTHNKRLQKGLVPEDKAQRVTNYVNKIKYEVGVIAHSCGTKHPHELHRSHARIVQSNGISIALSELHPDVSQTA